MAKAFRQLGFIGLGVMGEPMCRNLAAKSGLPVLAHDLDPGPLGRLAGHGVRDAGSATDAMRGSDVVFLSLPSGEVVEALCRAPQGLLACAATGQVIVDLSTSRVDTTRRLAAEFAAKGATFIDAPVARTRAAAESGTLAVMVGADDATFAAVRPLIATFASDIAHCGPVGCGQVLKILNNMLLFQHVMALAEAKAIGERMGVDARVLFETLATGSADSFALRSHGMKAMLPGEYPLRAFSVRYAQKDLRYGLRLGEDAGLALENARRVDALFSRAIGAGDGDRYWPVASRAVVAGA